MKLSVNGISFDYGSKQTLDNVTFEADEGKIIGILGQNGCGKTTLLKCIDRMLKPNQGTIVLESPPDNILEDRHDPLRTNDLEIRDMSRKELARCIAVVSQSAFISFPFTSFDTVMMGRYSRSDGDKDTDTDAVIRAMSQSGSLEFAERPVNELSGGELRRVLIGRALAQEPNILLLDEPTLHLDINHQFDLMNLINDLKKNNMIIIMVTHDLMLAARYCDQIILMSKGSIVDAGDTENVLTRKNIKDIFDIDAIVEYDERVKGLNVVMIGK